MDGMKETPIIKFDRYWKKLKDGKGLFTTIRRFTPQKCDYYRERIGREFKIMVSDKKDGFKGFDKNEIYMILLFEFTGTDTARLLNVDDRHFSNLSKELIEYDTRE